MYPLKFNNIYFDKVWGGKNFKLLRDNAPDGNIGESWDIACHKNGTNIVVNGEFKGMPIDELIKLKGEKLIGSCMQQDAFPLLLKLINTSDKLSIQVHPDDEYEKRHGSDSGKTEAWYVIDAFEGANLTIGVKGDCTKEAFKRAAIEGNLDKYLNEIPVKKGDVFFIKSGLVHSIGKNVIIAEIQQNSDITYRIYDYNRGRDLQLEKGLDAIKLDLPAKQCFGIKVERKDYTKTYLCLSQYFSLELYDIKEAISESSDKERFYIFTCVHGIGEITGGYCTEAIKKGDSILIPASLGDYTFKGEMKLLKSYVPNLRKVEEEILKEIEV